MGLHQGSIWHAFHESIFSSLEFLPIRLKKHSPKNLYFIKKQASYDSWQMLAAKMIADDFSFHIDEHVGDVKVAEQYSSCENKPAAVTVVELC